MLQPPFDAARSAISRDILDSRLYAFGVAVNQTTFRAVPIGGAAAGGAIVAFTSPRTALAGDAVTFAVSALLIRFGVRARTAAAPVESSSRTETTSTGSARPRAPSGARIVWGNPAIRKIMLLGWLAAFYEVPEGIAAPYAAGIGGGAAVAGLLIASSQAMIVAAPLYARLPAAVRERWMWPMAIAASTFLTLTAFRPGVIASMVTFVAPHQPATPTTTKTTLATNDAIAPLTLTLNDV